MVVPKNTNKTKTAGTQFGPTTDSFIEKYETISVKFKIHISEVIVKIKLKQ